ncbi:flagellin C-terminal helical region [Desulfotomaculum arcticum]|uniref:Flagellin C-terminal helical region n=1 Tax=Desulfotruncus arcticus DSM 17038 TaxID=1121424 RepID=A0A1I2P049_9FIRM|nr:flagellin C-terminal helical region [Desulfotomaculum arcticum] [Desulfotruncus arcticus DSM 17038]
MISVGADADATAASIIAAINDHAVLGDRFTAASSGNSIALTENATKATGDNLTDPDVKGDATAGKYKFQMSALKAGSTVTIDNQKLILATGGNETETAAALKEAIEADATLNAQYTVTASGAEVTLTQKEGQESANAPTLSYTTKAGDGYRTRMQIGANTGQSMSLDVNDMRANALGVTSNTGTAGQTVEVEGKQYAVAWTSTQSVTNGTDDIAVEFALDVSTHDNATAAVKVINNAIETVSAERSKLGAFQNRLEHTINNLGTSSENLTAAESRIRDVDMAKEMIEFTKNNILSQAAQAMLAQANQQPQNVLQLLR